MSVFCVPKHLIEKLKNSALKGEVNIAKLYEMSSAERRAYFEGFTSPELGKFLNTEFEKAMVSKQENALMEWAQSTFTPKAKASPNYQNVLDKIKTLDDIGVLSPESEKAFLEDLVSDKLGVSVSPQEITEIKKRAEKIDKAYQAVGENLGDPAFEKEQMAFFEAKKEMDDYLKSLNPSSNLKVATGTIGRGMMLFSVKSPILNIGSNIEVGLTEAISRRLVNMRVKGTDTKMVSDYVKMVWKIYQKTGYDLSRMMSISDAGESGARVLGDTVHTQGKGAVRKAGRVVEDIVFKQLMGAPDAAFGAIHFADSVNINAMKVAKGDKVKAKAIMTDAMRLVPQTAIGEVVREQGIMDAQVATWTNNSWASKASSGIRSIINELSGDLRLGDQWLPFIKTPANVIETGLDYAGLGIPKAMAKTVKAFRSGDLRSKQFQVSAIRDIVRAGLGLTLAAIIANGLDDDDFVGAYDPERKQIEALRNSTTNSIRVGGKWISTDWLGPLAVAVSSIMYARQQKGSLPQKATAFGLGAFSEFTDLPGVSDLIETVDDANNKKGLFGDAEEKTDTALNWVYSRLSPSFVGDIAKATDSVERKTTDQGVGATIKSRIPGLRQTLPIKKTILGDEMKTEPALSTILFGSRVKTDKEDRVIRELSDVQKNADKSLNFTDWDTSASKTLAQFREKVGKDKFEEAKKRYGNLMRAKVEEALSDPKYQALDDEEKHTILNGLDAWALERIFTDPEYGFKYIPEKKAKVEYKL